MPGGKIDAGETPEEALVRELREELGIEVEVGLPFEPVSWQYENGGIRLLSYACEIRSGELTVMSHERIAWVGLDELEGLEWAPADVPVLAQIEALWGGDFD